MAAALIATPRTRHSPSISPWFFPGYLADDRQAQPFDLGPAADRGVEIVGQQGKADARDKCQQQPQWQVQLAANSRAQGCNDRLIELGQQGRFAAQLWQSHGILFGQDRDHAVHHLTRSVGITGRKRYSHLAPRVVHRQPTLDSERIDPYALLLLQVERDHFGEPETPDPGRQPVYDILRGQPIVVSLFIEFGGRLGRSLADDETQADVVGWWSRSVRQQTNHQNRYCG